jgi:predicted RNA-binding protein with PUA-like domain
MAYWLLKTEPSDYSFGDLQREKRVVWSGVSNAAALKNLRAMAKGDEVLIYHTGDERAVVGLATVAKAAYPDPNQKDARFVVVDLAAKSALKKPVTLAMIKADVRFAEWGLVKIGRLSVVPTTKEQFEAVLKLGG